MRKFIVVFLFIVLLPVVYFSSCAKDEDDDNDPPVIEYARMNVDDTLYLNEDRSIKLNDSTNINHEIDTVVIGKWLYINAAFRDKGRGLSSFKVETNLTYKYNGDVPENEPTDKYKDSIFEIVRLGRNIFGKDTARVAQNRLIQIPDSITRNYAGALVTLKLVVDDYPLKVVCLDIGGNRDSVIFPVRYLHRNTVYEAYLK